MVCNIYNYVVLVRQGKEQYKFLETLYYIVLLSTVEYFFIFIWFLKTVHNVREIWGLLIILPGEEDDSDDCKIDNDDDENDDDDQQNFI